MERIIHVDELSVDEWARLRTIRLESLLDSPHAYGATHETEAAHPPEFWLERMAKVGFYVATVDGVDSAVMSIEELDGDFGAKVWLGGCWVNPQVRGSGVMKAMIDFIDSFASERGWDCQGLGVWHDNYSAIASYERLGFVKMGDLQESSRKPGMYFQRMIRTTPT